MVRVCSPKVHEQEAQSSVHWDTVDSLRDRSQQKVMRAPPLAGSHVVI